jgi:hypothetical protein
MPLFGTHSLSELLTLRGPTIEAYGEQNLLNDITDALNIHNAAVRNQLLGDIRLEVTDEQLRAYGQSGGVRARMHKIDEFGLVDAQRVRSAPVTGNLGFPLERNQFAAGFTRDFIQTRSPRDAALIVQGAQEADLDVIEYEVKTAFFSPINRTFEDYLIDFVSIPVKRFFNADNMLIPNYRQRTFDAATHTHYVGRAGGALAAEDIDAAINNVIEHGVAGPVEVWINLDDELEVTAFPSFWEDQPVEFVTPVLAPGTIVPRQTPPTIQTVNPEDPENRRIGTWRTRYVVRTKPWVPAGYILVIDTGKRPLAWRVRDAAQGPASGDTPGRADLRLVAELETFPLRGQVFEREFGIGTADRAAVCILYTGGTSYVMPTISMPVIDVSP